MRQLLAAVLLSLTASGAWASDTGGDTFTAEKLYGMCSSPMRDDECIMFIAGTLQGMGVQAYMNNIQDECMPLDDKSISDVKNIVVGYLAANKGMFPYPAASSIVLALGTDDCKAKLTPLR